MTFSIRFFVPIRLGRGLNDREHPMARHRRIKSEKEVVGWTLKTTPKPQLPCRVKLTRHAPGGRGLDSDNLQGSLKATRDAVAAWLGVDDAHEHIARYEYDQKKNAGSWGVSIEIEETQHAAAESTQA